VAPSTVLFGAGDPRLVLRPCISIIGSRKASLPGLQLATTVSWALCRAGIVIVSGLAKGIDAAAHRAALSCYSDTVGVIGTGHDRAYPVSHGVLQETIAKDHLLLSPFPSGCAVQRGNFPRRNKLMAALSDATVIIEAGDSSGALHQAKACKRLGRWLFIPRVVAEDSSLSWPAEYLGAPRVRVFEDPDEVLEAFLLPRLAQAC
jgi:DNA processing protein